MPRNRLVLRQITLSAGVLLACLPAWAVAGLLLGTGSAVLTVVAVVPMLAGLVVPVMVWFVGEDPLDRSGGWFVTITTVTIMFAVAVGAGVPGTYLELAGRRVPVVVTAGDDAAGDGYQFVEVTATDTGERLGRVRFFAGQDVRAGDRLVVVFDPLGRLPPGTGRPAPDRSGALHGLAAAGMLLLITSTVLRIRRDLRRYDFTGSRRPPGRPRPR